MRQKLFSMVMLAMISLSACEEDYSPKPMAYARIELPYPVYDTPDSSAWDCPYVFEFSKEARIVLNPRYRDSTCWYNLWYPKLRATVHLTYSPIRNNLSKHIEENRKLAMKHIVKATGIPEIFVEQQEREVYGLIYDFKGETACDMQFFLTDSNDHFFRGSLYFNTRPNKDSLAPAIRYVKQDIRHLVNTFRWTE